MTSDFRVVTKSSGREGTRYHVIFLRKYTIIIRYHVSKSEYLTEIYPTFFCHFLYRVYHNEMVETKWLWGVEGSITLLNYGVQWLQEDCTFVFYQPVFKKMTSAGLNSLQQKEHQISVKNGIFDDPCHKKGLVFVIWVLGMIKTSESVIFLMKWGCWGHWGHWGCWGHWGHWGCRGFKAWKITTEDFRIFQFLEFNNLRTNINLFWCFEKKRKIDRIMKTHVEF